MGEVIAVLGWVLFGLILGLITAGVVVARRSRRAGSGSSTPIARLAREHFAPIPLGDLTISTRRFPHRVRADIQRAMDRLLGVNAKILRFSGVRKEYPMEVISLQDCLAASPQDPAVAAPPEYEDLDVGEEAPLRCLRIGLWFLEREGTRLLVLLAPASRHGVATGIECQIAAVNGPQGIRISDSIFRSLEEAVLKAESYRGKILSLEQTADHYSGTSAGIKVHRLKTVDREEVILPRKTLALLERNVIDFVRRRPALAAAGQPTKKGLLFYGPPGTGKTHTIHYLAKALQGQTTLVITAEQFGLLSEYMVLARLLQPSVVVMEDVDLIATDRSRLGTCEEVLLNGLLNEMDGLRAEADILFILTTNRPEALERALSSRPGRIDQAIEFPLPDEEGRAKLARLYARGAPMAESVVEAIVRRTAHTSAAFIKELMRRSTQFRLERDGQGSIDLRDVENALEEMLFSGGSLNLKLLGADGALPSHLAPDPGTS